MLLSWPLLVAAGLGLAPAGLFRLAGRWPCPTCPVWPLAWDWLLLGLPACPAWTYSHPKLCFA